MEVLYFLFSIIGYVIFGIIIAGVYFSLDDGDYTSSYIAGFLWPFVLIYGIGKLFFIIGEQIGKLIKKCN